MQNDDGPDMDDTKHIRKWYTKCLGVIFPGTNGMICMYNIHIKLKVRPYIEDFSYLCVISEWSKAMKGKCISFISSHMLSREMNWQDVIFYLDSLQTEMLSFANMLL